MIARLSEETSAALVCNKFLQQILVKSIEIPFPMKKYSVATAQNLHSIKTYLTLEVTQHSKSGNTSAQNKSVTASSYFLRLGHTLC